jgi:hypothetical protein
MPGQGFCFQSLLQKENDIIMKENDFYKEEIIKMIKKIDNQSVLRYIYIIVSDIIKELKE